MKKIKAMIELTRPRNMVISFLGVLVGALLISKARTIELQSLIAAFSAMVILAGGNALNDYYDYPTDKVNRPKRPIPSGRIKKETAKLFAIILFLIGILSALLINKYCLTLAIINSTVLTAYAKHSKKALLTSNLTVSYLTASVFIYGALSTLNTTAFNPSGIKILAILATSSFFMTLTREIIKDIEDVKGDQKTKSITLPIKYGIKTAKHMAVTSGLASTIISLIPFITQTPNFNTLPYALFIIPANLIFILSYFKTPGKSQKYIVLGMTTSLIAFLTGRIL